MFPESVRIRLRVCLILLPVFILIMTMPAAAAPGLQSYCEDEDWYAYIPRVRQENADVDMQIANTALLTMQTSLISEEEGMGIHTILLFDNSFSISEHNRDVMKQAAIEIIDAHVEGECYTVAVFDDSVTILAQESSDYEYLKDVVRGIEYASQPTFLKDALNTVYERYGEEGGYYKRFAVLSDGCDDDPVGYTYDEIREKFVQSRYPVYVIGSLYEEDPRALQELFSLSRVSGGAYFLLDEMENTDSIPVRFSMDAPLVFVRSEIPFEAQDGGSRNIRLIIYEPEEEQEFYTSTQMPFAKIPEQTEEPPDAVQASQEEPAVFSDVPDSIPDETEPSQTLVPAEEAQPEEEPQPQTSVQPLTQPPAQPLAQSTESLPQIQDAAPAEKQEEVSFLEDDSLISGIRNSYICAAAAFILGSLFAVMLFRKKKEEEPSSGSEDMAEEAVREPEEQRFRDDDATMILKNYPGPAAVRWSDEQ